MAATTSSVAYAKQLAVVVRGAGAGSDKAAGFVAHHLRELLAQDDRYDVADLSQILGGDTAERAKRAFEMAEEEVQKGRAAYETLDLDPAIDHLNTALNKFERNCAHVTDIKKVAEVLMLLGATHILRGEEKTGAKRLAQAIALDPNIEADPRVFNPSMRAVFQDAVNRLSQRPPGTLSLASNPSYAEIFVDGKFVGITPMAVDKVTEGRHYVRLVREGYRTWGKVIEVVGQVEASDTATLKATDTFEEYDALVEAAFPSLPNKSSGDKVGVVFRQLGDLLKVDELLFAEVRLDGERVKVLSVLVDVKDAAVLKSASQVFSYDSRPEIYVREIGDLIKKNFGGGGKVAGGKDADKSSEADAAAYASGGQCAGMSCQKFKTLLLAVGAGGGVLLGGLGSLFDYLAYADNTEYKKTAQTSTTAADLRGSGKTKAILGDIFVLLGVAAAGVSIGMYFFWHPAPSTAEVVGQKGGGWSAVLLPLDNGAALSWSTTF
ncbi:MAG: PEGA domain-containing protein [Deltaproteobacteria bacterium]|nr:PEGA domain-containing protein [Deltaproteobacteria bacterium]